MSELALESQKELPEGWIQTTIGEILFLINGKAFKPSDWSNKGLPIVRIQNLNDSSKSFNYCNLEVDKKFLIKDGDLLFSWSGTPDTSFGAFMWNGGKAILNQHIFKIKINENMISKKFLQHILNYNVKEYIGKAHGTAGLAHITKGKFEESFIQLPPYNEQKRIVAKIEELFSIVEKYENDLKISQEKISILISTLFQTFLTGNLKNLFQNSISNSTFDFKNFKNPQKKFLKEIKFSEIEKQPKIPPNWSWVRLGEICMIKDVNHKMPKAVKNGIHFVSPKDFLDDGTIDFENTKQISRSDYEENTKKVLPRVGDILFSRYGTLGKAILVPNKEFGLSYSIAVIRPFFEEINLYWLYFLLQSPFVLHQAIQGEQSSTMADLGLITIRNFLIPLPPSNEQKIISNMLNEYLSTANDQLDQIQKNLKITKHLRSTILKQAFKGKLVPQDPNDESAEILLQKIKLEKKVYENKLKNEKQQLKQKQKTTKRKKNV